VSIRKFELGQKARVAELMSQDLSAEVIALRLGINRKTVFARMSDIRRDLNVPAHD
jgi:DNA-binding CsgD family transcriptional regulator